MYGSGDQNTGSVSGQDAPTSRGISDNVTGAQVPATGDASSASAAGSSVGTSSNYPQGSGASSAPYGSTGQNISGQDTYGSTGQNLTGQNTYGSTGQNLTGQSTSTNPTSSHLGRDAALTGGARTAAYEAEKHHHHNNQPSGTSSGLSGVTGSQPGQAYSGTNTGSGLGQTGSRDHHLGRDAAGASALGAGAYEAEKHHHNKDHQSSNAGLGSGAGSSNTGSSAAVSGPKDVIDHYRHHATDGSEIPEGQLPGDLGEYDPRRGKHPSNQTAPPGTTGGSTKGVPESSSGSNNDNNKSHLGRDATVGAGTAALADEAEKHHDRNHNNSGSNSGLSGTTSHDNSDRSHLGRDTAGLGAAGLAAGEAERLSNRNNTSNTGVTSGLTGTTSDSTHGHSHLGRDAAGAGAAGVAARDHGNTNTGSSDFGDRFHQGPLGSHEHNGHGHTYGGDPCPPGEEPTYQANFTHGPHAVDTANRLDPHVPGEFPGAGGTDRHQHHTGRDAALAGGAGAAGLGAYEANRGHNNDTRDLPTRGLQSGSSAGTESSSTVGPHSSNLANRADPRVDSDLSRQQPGQQHHYGRDAALVGGAGALGTGAYEADRHHHNNNLDPLASGATSGTTADPHSSDVANRADPRVDSDLSRQQPGQQHHYGRDAALAGGAGTLGAGSLEAERNHHHNRDPLTSGTSTGSQPSTTFSDQRAQAPGQQHHYGRDAAALGGAGALGAGAYEAERNHHNRDQLTGTTTGSASDPYTHPRSAVTGSQSTDPQHHYGRDATALGGGAMAGHELSKKEAEHAEKERKHAEKQHEKDLKAAEKHHDKNLQAAEKHHEKEEKKSGGLLGFLHKDKKHGDTTDTGHDKHEHEAEAAGTSLAGARVAEHGYKQHTHSAEDPTGTGFGYYASGEQGQSYPGARVAPGSYGSTILPPGEGQAVYDHHHYGNQGTAADTGLLSTGSSQHEPNRHTGTTGTSDHPSTLSETVHNHPERYHQGGDHRNRLHKDPPAGV